MEARGFIWCGGRGAHGAGLVPIRKPGKLPVPVLAIDYALEYGTDTLEIDPDAITPGQNVVIIDDLIATGGTALVTAQLLRRAEASISHALFVIDLPDLGGAGETPRGGACRIIADGIRRALGRFPFLLTRMEKPR